MWAYAYQILPPQPRVLLRAIRELLTVEHAAARADSRLWTGRLVCARDLTHILIVTDDIQHDHSINLRLETELGLLNAEFSISEPVRLPGHPAAHLDMKPHPKPM